MTTRLILTLALLVLLMTAPGIAADVDAPAVPPGQPAAATADTETPPAPAPELTSLEMLERIDGFYNRAYLMLLGTLTFLIALLVALAAFFQWRQSKSFDEVKKELKDDIATVDAEFKALSGAQDKFSKSNEGAMAAIAGQLSASETALHRGVGAALGEVGMHSATMSTNVAGALGTLAYSLHESYLGNDRVQVLKTLAYITRALSDGQNRECLKRPGVRNALDTVLGEVQSMSQGGDDLSLPIAILRQMMIGRAATGDAADTESDDNADPVGSP